MNDDRMALALDRYVDTLLHDGNGVPADDLDAGLAETARRLHHHAQALQPDPDQLTRVWAGLIEERADASAAAGRRRPESARRPAGVESTPSLPTRLEPRASRSRSLWPYVELVAASILIAALLGVSFGGARLVPRFGGQPRDELPSGVFDQPLARVTLPPLPPASARLVLSRTSFKTGADWLTERDAGPAFLVAETGLLTAVVVAGDGSAQPAVTLRAGDQLVVPAEAGFTVRPIGDGPADFLQVSLLSLKQYGNGLQRTSLDMANTTTPFWGYSSLPAAELPPGPVVVTLRRITLAPGAGLPTAAGPMTLVLVEDGVLTLSRGNPNGPTPPAEIRLVKGTATLVHADSVRSLVNAGSMLLVFYTVTLEPA